MAYQLHNFTAGQTILAQPFNEMDAQILQNKNNISELRQQIQEILVQLGLLIEEPGVEEVIPGQEGEGATEVSVTP